MILKVSVFAVMLLFAGNTGSFAQSASSTTSDDTKSSLAISTNIIKLIGSLVKDFKENKGSLLTKTDDGTNVYEVTNLEGMLAESEFIMVKSGGASYYIASYTDTKKMTMSFAAFTAGVATITNGDGNFTIAQDKEKSVGDKLVYTMSVKGTKVGSYTMEVKKNEGTMIIGFL